MRSSTLFGVLVAIADRSVLAENSPNFWVISANYPLPDHLGAKGETFGEFSFAELRCRRWATDAGAS